MVLLAVAFFAPADVINANANIGLEASTEVRVSPPNENIINIRRLDLQKKLFKEKVENNRAEFARARENFQNATPDTRNIMRSEFRAKFLERFKFTIEKLSDFQTRMSARIENEASAGVDVSLAKIKLEESISLMAEIEMNIEKLKSVLEERYAEDEREAKKEEVKNLVEKIKSDIKSSHMALRESMSELVKAKTQNAQVETSIETEINVN